MRRRRPKPLDPFDELALRPDYNRIFVSSKMAGGAFRNERVATARAIESLPEFRAWYWERDARAGPYYSRELCARTARSSDGLVLLLGDELTDITRDEFLAAHRSGAPCFIFLDERHSRNPEAEAFVKREWEHAVTQPFSSSEELEQRVRHALVAYGRNNWRHQLLEHRARRAESARRRYAALAIEESSAGASYEEMGLEIVGEDGKSRQVVDIVSEARQAAAKGLHLRVYEELWDIAESAREAGLAQVALDLFGQIRRLLAGRLDAEQDAWITNSEGICLGRLGLSAEASARYLEMKTIGDNLGDGDIVATALQNLAASAFSAKDLERAAELSRASFSMKVAIGDYYGATQVMGNLAATAAESGDLDWADELLSFVADVAHEFRDPGILNSLEGNLGNLCAKRGQFDTARKHFRRALSLARRSGDFGRECNTLISVARVELDLGRPAEALRWYRKGLELAETIRDPDQLHSHAIGAALASIDLSRADDAAKYFEVARDASASMGDTEGWASATADLAAVEIERDPGRAEALLEEALAAFTTLEDWEWQTRILRNAAAFSRRRSDPIRAIEKLKAALALLPNDAHDERAEILALTAEAALMVGDNAAAARLVSEQLLEQRAAGLRGPALTWQIATTAATLSNGGAEAESIPHWREAIKRYRRAGDKELLFSVRNDYANSLTELGRFDTALAELNKSRALAAELSASTLALQSEMNRAEVLRRAGRVEEAIVTAQEALAVPQGDEPADDSELRELQVKTLTNLALSFTDAERLAEAEQAAEQARVLARESRRRDLEADADGMLGRVAYLRGKFAKAARTFGRSARANATMQPGRALDDLAAVVQSWSAAGGTADFDEHVQRLVDEAEASGQELSAAERLTDAARLWLGKDVKRGADLYTAATVLAFVDGNRRGAVEATLARRRHDGNEEPEGLGEVDDAQTEALVPGFEAIGRVLATAAVHAELESPEVSKALKKELPRALSRHQRGLGMRLKPLLELAWEAAARVTSKSDG